MINSKYSWSAENRVEIINNLKTITNEFRIGTSELRISYELTNRRSKLEPTRRSLSVVEGTGLGPTIPIAIGNESVTY